MSRKKRICILSEFGYASITGKGTYIGGAEVQMSIRAKELVKRSYDVSFVTFGKTSSLYEVIEGVKVYNVFDNRVGGYSYLFPQNIYKLIKILNKIDADIYIKKGYSPLTGVVAFVVKLMNKVFLFVISHEWDVSINLDISNITNLSNIFYRFGVKHCYRVICQTHRQKNLLEQKIGKDGVVIKNLYLVPKIENIKRDPQRLKILWVGRLAKWKRVELFLKLAEKLPDCRFWMIAPEPYLHELSHREYHNKIKKAVDKIDNLDFIGYIPHKKINRYYRESSMLVSTSICEGFPNTFLEAWGNSIPVVSLGFDPDEIICNNKLGFHSKTFEQMVEDVQTLLKNESLRKEMSMNSRRYVEKEHDIKKILNEYQGLFNRLTF